MIVRPTEQQLQDAQSADTGKRLDLAAQPDLPRELLAFLAADLAPEVRKLVAENPSTPQAAELVLAQDKDEAVRAELVDKTVARIDGNDVEETEPLTDLVVQILDILADDDSDAIRIALSSAIADLRHAPHSAVSRLANDTNPNVASPVLSASPVLNQEDLLRAVDRCTSEAHLNAVAGRPRLPGNVAEAVVALGRDSATLTLLNNPSAHLREETLDRVLDDAPNHPSWHDALVNHPQMSRQGADRLSSFIAASLIDALEEAEEARCELAKRTAHLTKTRLERESDPLAEPALRKLIAAGDLDGLADRLATRAKINQEVVIQILAAAAPRAVIALSWAAGLTMEFAVSLQSQVARVPPHAMLRPTTKGSYPMSDGELTEQIRLFDAEVMPPDRSASA